MPRGLGHHGGNSPSSGEDESSEGEESTEEEEEDNTVWGSEEGEVFSDGEGGILQWGRVGRMVENPCYSLD